MNPIRFAMLSALLSPLVAEDDEPEQEPGAPATGEHANEAEDGVPE